MGRTIVVGDIHGAFKALEQALHRANFDPSTDAFLGLGDFSDGWPETKEVLDFYLSLDSGRRKWTLGNHDLWIFEWLRGDHTEFNGWYRGGGQATIESLTGWVKPGWRPCPKSVSEEYGSLEAETRPYHILDNKLFVHGGYNPSMGLQGYTRDDFCWDRDLWFWAKHEYIHTRPVQIGEWDRVFIGHTPTQNEFPDLKPVRCGNLWNLDQGAGWDGKLTVMDLESEEWWQSDVVKTLYPNHKGRGG